MRGNRFTYYIREGVGSIFNHGFMSFASVCIIVACLLIMGSFTLLALNVDKIIDTMESQNELMAFVDDSLTREEAQALEPSIEALPNVDHAVFITRETAWDDFVDTYENPRFFEGLDSSVTRDRYVVYLEDISLMEETRDNLVNDVPGINWVRAHLEISQGFVRIRNVVTLVSLALVVVLFVISLFIMSNTIKLTTFERRDEIAIMKMVGATSTFIRWPFVIQGLILGLLGAMVSFTLEWGIYEGLVTQVLSGAGISFLTVIPFYQVSIPILAAFAVVGLGVGVIGSLLAIKNYLKV